MSQKSFVSEIRERLGADWPAAIYRDRVRSQRTRAFSLALAPSEHTVEIQYTLLGIELKAGRKRFQCPDLGTARYLQVFARIGCDVCAVPYDITKISPIADLLETGWQKAVLLIDEVAGNSSPQGKRRVRSALIARLREEIEEIGPGALMPEFRQDTKQRRS